MTYYLYLFIAILLNKGKCSFAFFLFQKSYNYSNEDSLKNTTEDSDIIDLDEIDIENVTSRSSDNSDEIYKEVTPHFFDEVEHQWMTTVIQDIGHYLRNYRFGEYDRRYLKEYPEKFIGQYFAAFPNPPLRSLHWEVQQMCEESFSKCLKYLESKIEEVVFKKMDDTVYVINEMEWTMENNLGEILNMDSNCRELLNYAYSDATPFAGPLERFQWSTTASYYMCWYTMHEHPALEHFQETCDNFANCLGFSKSTSNNDPRANDSIPFACAQYSFCPDTCCPIKEIKNIEECLESKLNPCHQEDNEQLSNSTTHSDSHGEECVFERSRNLDFISIVRNHMNVTCACQNSGYIWLSKYGLCVDIDECISDENHCQEETEICINTKGSYICACNWGNTYNSSLGHCEPNEALIVLKKEKEQRKEELEQEETKINLSFFHFIKTLLVNLFAGLFKNS